MPAPWTRRRALRALAATGAAGLAGCLGGPAGVDGTQTTRPAAVDIAFTATVERSFTAEHPGRVRLALSNEGEMPFAMTVTHGIEGPLSIIVGDREGGDATLVVLADPPAGDHETPPGAPCRSDGYAIPEERIDGCWRPACDFARMRAHYAIPMDAGATIAWPYVVLDGFNEACLPPGTYTFLEAAAIAVGRETGGATPPGGPTHVLDKRLAIDLDDDGSLAADATVEVSPVSAPASPDATDPETPRPGTG